ncbi:hypothetical protein F4561_001114 [Lipingzhangella halophila]|uniref:DUF5058 family protein n=1 Tax=Lipingzhangella halophila TaxID=1783352 RepID=A0A7W7RE97_9ACTN|nr:DUF5058 family protein [Lipingzhangella halophila]MBB4930294.1 hypothetical protein [Lipingzhangella halophila]
MGSLAAYTNSAFLWICALAAFAVIALQTVIYMRAARTAGPDLGFTPQDWKRSLRSGAIAAIGPSLAVAVVAVALLALFGTPAVLVRIGLVGSAATETASADLAAGTMGAELGGASWSPEVFATALFAMSLSGGMWLVTTLILTPLLKRGDTRLRRTNPTLMAIVPSAALLGAFASLSISELPNGTVNVLIVAVSALVMAGCLLLARWLGLAWLREWALGISIIIGLVAAYFAHFSAIGPA